MLFVGLAILFVVLSLWLTATVAKALGAGNPSMLGIIASGAVSGLIMAPISLAVTNPALLVVVSLIVSTLSLAKFLDMNLVGAFLVYLANGLIWGIFIICIVFFGLGLGFDWGSGFANYDGEISLAEVERTAEGVCACGVDEDCQIEEYFRHSQAYQAFIDSTNNSAELNRAERYTARADECYDHPRPYTPHALVEGGQAPRPAYIPADTSPASSVSYSEYTEPAAPKQARVKSKPEESIAASYQEVPLHEMVRFLSHPMRITRKDQKQFEGQASLMPNGDVRLTNRRQGGEFGLVIPKGQMMRVEVYKVWRPEKAPAEDEEIVASAQG